MPLHWFTEVTNWFELVTVVVQPEGGRTPAAARHAVAVTVDDSAPADDTVLLMVIVQLTSIPAPVGKAGGLHWVAVGALAAAEAAWVSASPPRVSIAIAVAAATAIMDARRTVRELALPMRLLMRSARLGCRNDRRKWRNREENLQHACAAPIQCKEPEINNRESDVRDNLRKVTLVIDI
jgi:hypothetical protein